MGPMMGVNKKDFARLARRVEAVERGEPIPADEREADELAEGLEELTPGQLDELADELAEDDDDDCGLETMEAELDRLSPDELDLLELEMLEHELGDDDL